MWGTVVWGHEVENGGENLETRKQEWEIIGICEDCEEEESGVELGGLYEELRENWKLY